MNVRVIAMIPFQNVPRQIIKINELGVGLRWLPVWS